MFEWVKHIDPVVGTIMGVLGLIGAVSPFIRKAIKRTRELNAKLEAGMDSLLGYGPVLDPATGTVLKQATPSMAVRVDTIEDAIKTMAETQLVMAELTVRMNHMEEWRGQHETWSQHQLDELHRLFLAKPKED